MVEIITLGEILIDLFSIKVGVSLAEAPGFTRAPGGAPANVAVGIAKLGRKSAFIGKVGSDQFGNFLIKTLKENNVDTSQVKISSDVRTTLAFISPREDGERDFCFYRSPGADLMLSPEEISEDFISQAKIFHFGSLSLVANPSREATFKAIEYAKEAGLVISYDPNLRLSLWDSKEEARRKIIEGLKVSDIVKVNQEELFFITEKNSITSAVGDMLRYRAKIIFITQGRSESAFVRKDGKIHYVDTFQVKSVDATGCGDAFMAAVLVCLLERIKDDQNLSYLEAKDLKEIVRYANAAGALTSLKMGVVPALPKKEEVGALCIL